MKTIIHIYLVFWKQLNQYSRRGARLNSVLAYFVDETKIRKTMLGASIEYYIHESPHSHELKSKVIYADEGTKTYTSNYTVH